LVLFLEKRIGGKAEIGKNGKLARLKEGGK
jgi:hypothetical protein